MIDLSNLREMTGGDAELERELFAEFIRSGAEFVQTLAASTDDAHRAQWRACAHAFKGTALNLGASHLGDLCKQAQDGFEKPAAEKQALLTQITAAFQEAKAYLATV